MPSYILGTYKWDSGCTYMMQYFILWQETVEQNSFNTPGCAYSGRISHSSEVMKWIQIRILMRNESE
jgi:hypothetical protein